MRVKVELLANAPFALATAVTDFASNTGAAWTEFAENAAVSTAAGNTTPSILPIHLRSREKGDGLFCNHAQICANAPIP